MDCNSSKCEYSIFHQKGCRDPGCLKVRETRNLFSPTSLEPRACTNKSFHRIMALKYKKWSTQSTMTALRVAQQQPGPLHVDSLVLVSRLPRTRHDLFLSTSNTPFIIGPTRNLNGFPTLSHGATLCCPAVHLVCSCRVVTIVYPMLAQHPPRMCIHLVLALLYYYPVCIAAIYNNLRLTLALQHLSTTTQYFIPCPCPRLLL